MDSSPFEKLAPELRNSIYALALTHDSKHQKMDIRNYKADTALLRVCSQIRNEATGIYFSSNDFYYHIPAHDRLTRKLRMLPQWVLVIGKKNAVLIRSLEIEYELGGSSNDYHITSFRHDPFKPVLQSLRHVDTRDAKTPLLLRRLSHGSVMPVNTKATDISASTSRFLDIVSNKPGDLQSGVLTGDILRAVRVVEVAIAEVAVACGPWVNGADEADRSDTANIG